MKKFKIKYHPKSKKVFIIEANSREEAIDEFVSGTGFIPYKCKQIKGGRLMIKAFFYSGGRFQPVYAWITLFCLLVAITFVQKIVMKSISAVELISLLGFIQIWVGLYNKNKNGNHKETS